MAKIVALKNKNKNIETSFTEQKCHIIIKNYH